MHPSTDALLQNCEAFSERWCSLYKRWIAGGLPTNERYVRLLNSTMDEYSQRVHAGVALVQSLKNADENTDLLLLHRLEPAQKNLSVSLGAVDALLSQLNSKPQAQFKVQNASLDTLKVFILEQHTENIQVGSTFDQLNTGLGGLIDFALQGLKTRKVRAIGQFTEAANAVLRESAEANSSAQTIKNVVTDTKALLEEVQAARVDVSRLVGEIEQAAVAAEAARGGVVEVQHEAEAKLATIRETSKAAGVLEAKVEAYDTSFEGFQQSLDARVSQHSAFEKNMTEALLINHGREVEIDRLTAKANDMIKGASTAGLGTSLEETRQMYESKMNEARNSFKWSISFLVLSALPLAMHLFPGLFGSWLGTRPAFSPGEVFNLGAVLELVGKMFLLFPATWTTQFFSKAYAEYFHLEREYAHKAALARAVEGFKKQAPKYEEEITTSVFFEVQSNPSKQLSPEAAEHPILGPVLKKFLAALPLPGKDKLVDK